MKLAVYTAICGSVKEKLYPVRPPEDGSVHYVCFTDRTDLATEGWEIRSPEIRHPTSTRRTARQHKLLPHQHLPGYDAWIWMDGCLELTVDPQQILQATPEQPPIATFQHPQRDCIYREHVACLRFRKDDPAVMLRQIACYRLAKHPEHWGLAETACLVIRNTDAACQLMNRWWVWVNNYSLRDQLSFPFVCRSLGTRWAVLPGCRDKSPYFRFHKRVHHGDSR